MHKTHTCYAVLALVFYLVWVHLLPINREKEGKRDMTIKEAEGFLNVPLQYANNTCIQHSQRRLREALDLAKRLDHKEAPPYVTREVANLKSWLVMLMA